jgi:hypothetical protein
LHVAHRRAQVGENVKFDGTYFKVANLGDRNGKDPDETFTEATTPLKDSRAVLEMAVREMTVTNL